MNKTIGLKILALGTALAAVGAFAEDEKPLKISGGADLYYQRDLNEPGAGTPVSLRSFDNNHKKVRLGSANLKLHYTPTKSPISATAHLQVGDSADINNLLEPAGSKRYKLFKEAYVTWAGPKGLTVDLGKFDTMVGYESSNASANDNYSLGLLNVLAQPVYHTGLRAKFPVGTMSGTAFVGTGWNEVEDINSEKTLGLSLSKSLNAKTNVSVSYIGGAEGDTTASGNNSNSFGGIGFAATGKRTTHLFDVVGTYAASDRTKYGFNFDYANALGQNGASSGKWSGVGLYVHNQMNDKLKATLRLEQFNDTDGMRTGTVQDLTSATLTGGFTLSKSAELRLEFRLDKSNKSVFTGEGGSLKKDRNTISVAYLVKF